MKEQSSIKDSNSLNKNVPLVPRSPVSSSPVPCSPVPYQLTFEDANRKLRFAIGTLQGKYESSIWKRRLSTVLTIKDELLAHGYFWQAEKLDFWIHRLVKQEKAKDLTRLQPKQTSSKGPDSANATMEKSALASEQSSSVPTESETAIDANNGEAAAGQQTVVQPDLNSLLDRFQRLQPIRADSERAEEAH